jgi:hypothetical protein
MKKPDRYISPEEWRRALVFLAYGVTKNPALAPSMEYAKRQYELSLQGDPVAEANRILEVYTRDGGVNAIDFKASSLTSKETP